MLEIENVSAFYGKHRAARRRVALCPHREIVVIRANGAGKTTLLKAIGGMVKVAPGTHPDGGRISPDAAHKSVEGIRWSGGPRHFRELTCGRISCSAPIGAAARAKEAAISHGVQSVSRSERLADRRHHERRRTADGRIGRAPDDGTRYSSAGRPRSAVAIMCKELFQILARIAMGLGSAGEQNAKQSLTNRDRILIGTGRSSVPAPCALKEDRVRGLSGPPLGLQRPAARLCSVDEETIMATDFGRQDPHRARSRRLPAPGEHLT